MQRSRLWASASFLQLVAKICHLFPVARRSDQFGDFMQKLALGLLVAFPRATTKPSSALPTMARDGVTSAAID